MTDKRKLKAVTFSYDDGVTQDQRLIEIFDKYGLRATFNLNSGLLGMPGSLVREGVTVAHVKSSLAEIRKIYDGHEIAAHTLTHPHLTKLTEREIIKEVEDDRIALSDLCGYEVVGMAYPGGGINNDERVADIIKRNTGVRYCRTTTSSNSFDLQDNLYRFNPTVYHHAEFDKMFELAREFIELKTDEPKIFYVWGHAYEFDIANTWAKMDEFCKLISGHDDIFYGTNSEVLLNHDWY